MDIVDDVPLPLPRVSPEAAGLPSAAVEAFLDQVASSGVELHSLMLLRHGEVLTEGWWAPYAPEKVHLLYSLSKSFTSTAVGLAIQEGLLSLSDPVVSFFDHVDASTLDPKVQRMTVQNLLSMASGHRDDTLPFLLDASDPAATFLGLVPEEEPGTWFTYNNGATFLLSLIITRLTGERLLDYLRPRLLDPLGIDAAFWDGRSPFEGHPGFDQGFSGLHLTTESVARFGQMYLDGGAVDGDQIVSEDWVADATSFHVDNPREPNPDWRQGYGYQFWMCQHDGVRGDGAYGQFCVLLPDLDVVLVTTAATEQMQAILDAAWDQLLPAFTDAPLPETAGPRLRDRMSSLELSTPLGTATRSTTVIADVDPDRWIARSGDPSATAWIREVTVTAQPDAEPMVWSLEVTDEHATYDVRCGHGRWIETTTTTTDGSRQVGGRLDVAGSAAWTSPTRLSVELAYTRTPHRLKLVLDVETQTLAAHWHTVPLRFPCASDLALAEPR